MGLTSSLPQRPPSPADVGGSLPDPWRLLFPPRSSGYATTCLGGQLPAHSPSFPGPLPSCALSQCTGLRSRAPVCSFCVQLQDNLPPSRSTPHSHPITPHSSSLSHSHPTSCPFRLLSTHFLAPLELDDPNARPSAELVLNIFVC